MNGYERITAALAGKETDKVPIMLHNFMMVAQEAGFTMEQYRNNPKAIADAFIQSVEKYRYDGILVDIDTVTLAGACGVEVDFPVNDPARSHKGLLQSLDDIKKLKPVDVGSYKYVQVWCEAVRILKDYFKDEVFVRGNCDQAPFSLASMIRGTENWMMDLLVTDESVLFGLLEYCTLATSQFIELMAQTGAHMVSNGDSPAGPDLIPAELYEKFALPYTQKVVEVAHQAGVTYTLHICGNTDIIIDQMIETGADGLELDYKTDIKKAFDRMHDKVTFFGNVDPSGVLALASPEVVRQKTIELLDVYRPSNRFVLNSGCALPSTTPSQNIEMFIKTAREYR
jgi:uroporphyrinogen decarboxylase